MAVGGCLLWLAALTEASGIPEWKRLAVSVVGLLLTIKGAIDGIWGDGPKGG